MAAGKKAEKGLRKKKKLWFTIRAAKAFNGAELGETTAYDAADLIGRQIRTNLMVLTNDMKKQNTIVMFKIFRVDGDNALAEAVGFHLMPAALKRMIRRGRDRIDMSFVCVTSDDRLVRLKLTILTRFNTSAPVNAALQKGAKSLAVSFVRNLTFDQLVIALTSYKLQGELRTRLKKVYPTKMIEVRALSLETAKKKHEAMEGAEKEPEEQAKEAERGEEKPLLRKPELPADETRPAIEANPAAEISAEENPAEQPTEEPAAEAEKQARAA